MGKDKIRHLVSKPGRGGVIRHYWQPSETIIELGLTPEALGSDAAKAARRAAELNGLADEMRIGARHGSNGPLPGSFAKLCLSFRASDEFADLKQRTRDDYTYYLGKIEAEFGHIAVADMTARVIKVYYKRVRAQVSVTWAYHILSTLRVVLSWGVSEDWIEKNPALDVTMKSPPKRRVVWRLDQTETYLAKAAELGWHSIVAMAHVFDSIGQSPVDVRTLTRKSYDGRGICVERAKTGNGGAPIPLFPAAKATLEAYLATQPAMLPEAPLFTHDAKGGMWEENALQKVHRRIRKAAGLPANLQLQDFRTTAATEGGASGGTRDELRGLLQHATGDASEHYVYPDGRFVDAIQEKRLAHRNKTRAKVGGNFP